MFKLRIFITAALLLHSINSLAYAPREGNVTTYFGPYLYKTNYTYSKSEIHSPELGGLGLVVNGDVNDKGSLEIGFFQMNKIYIREDSGSYITEQTALTHITMGYRRWFTEHVSASLTFFSAYSIGSPRVIYSDFSISPEIGTSARDTTEYGFDFAAQTELFSRQNYTVVLDARYSKSVTNKKNENADHYGVLLGLRYTIQEKSAAK